MLSEKNKIVSLPRAISKLGFASRSDAVELIESGKVKVNGIVVKNIKQRINLLKDIITVSDRKLLKHDNVYYMLNKPRGLVTTASDDKGRESVLKCFEGSNVPYIFPVGRLDKASEGLLLFTNDSHFSDFITNPYNEIEKKYHVQINSLPNENLFNSLISGVENRGEILSVSAVSLLRKGNKNSWLEITLKEGKNRHIRRLFETLNIKVLRIVRVSIGSLELGNLEKGKFRPLTPEEINSFGNFNY